MQHAAMNMDRSRCRTLAAALCMAASLALAWGCSTPRTFPSPSGDRGLSADSPPLPQVICDAVKFAHHEVSPNAPLVFNLPSEMNEPAWPTYERMLAPGKPMCPGDSGVWTVEQARIDGSNAQVDIQYPARDGFYQRLTVHLTGATAGVGYRPQYVQYWRVPVKDPVCNTPPAVQQRHCGARAAAAAKPGAAKPAASQATLSTGGTVTAGQGVRTEDPSK
jgi:hypothetical protein